MTLKVETILYKMKISLKTNSKFHSNLQGGNELTVISYVSQYEDGWIQLNHM